MNRIHPTSEILPSNNIIRDTDYVTITDSRKCAQLIISLSAGRNLPAMDLNGNSDCYAILTVGDISQKSKVVTSLNPVWHETFTFNIDYRTHCNYIIIDILDRDTLSHDDHIGIIIIHLSDCMQYVDTHRWLPLQRYLSDTKPKQSHGEIKLKLQLNNIIFNHNALYQNVYKHVLLPLTRSLSLNAWLLKSNTHKQDTNPSRNSKVLRRYIGFNAIPLASDDTKSVTASVNDEDTKDELPHFVDKHSTALYHDTHDKDAFIEYPVICEKIEVFIPHVMFLFNKLKQSVVYGDVYLTNFRVILKLYNKNLDVKYGFSQQLHFGAILEIECKESVINALQNKIANVLTMKVNDGRIIKMIINDKYYILLHEMHIKLNTVLKNLDNNIWNGNNTATHLIFKQNDEMKQLLNDKWDILDLQKEFKRQQVNKNIWKAVENAGFQLCDTYPSQLYIPCLIDEIKEIQDASSFRSKRRFPVLVWYNNKKNNSLLRCSQPSGNDSDYMDKIRKSVANYKNNLCFVNDVKVMIFDCRTVLAAEANRLKGKGTENVNKYTDNSFIEFLEIGNIHCMRQSYDALIQMVNNRYLYDEYTENKWLQQLKDTQWNDYIKLLIKSSSSVSSKLLAHKNTICIVHCSDGWDRTSQICSIAQLLIDPYYRTINGFIVLIEKDWLLFGHQFNERNGFVMHKKDKRSPIFMQFLECVWQIMQLYPAEFQFTTDFILRLCHHHNSNWFGTFLFNSQKQRIAHHVSQHTVSLWSWPVSKNKKYNPKLKHLYIDLEATRLQPIFHDYLLRFDDLFSELSNGNMTHIKKEKSEPIKPKWVKDNGCDSCFRCKASFNMFHRKHHCRSCGQIFCDWCSRMRIGLKQFDYNEPVRVCVECYELNKL